jgi:hypothetical protein
LAPVRSLPLFQHPALACVLERESTRAFKQFGLTPSQAFMLRVVLEKPALLQSELAKELAIAGLTQEYRYHHQGPLNMCGQTPISGSPRFAWP